MEGDRLCFHFTLLDIDLVTTEHDRDVLTDTDKVPMPVWNVLICDSASNVEHDDTAMTVDVVPISQSTKLLLTLKSKSYD